MAGARRQCDAVIENPPGGLRRHRWRQGLRCPHDAVDVHRTKKSSREQGAKRATVQLCWLHGRMCRSRKPLRYWWQVDDRAVKVG